jgi:hypothetical protein
MADDARLRQLLDELLDSHTTPEDVCRPCPELLPEVWASWRAVCRVRADLDVLFPAPTEPGVRAPAALEKLPPAERQEFRALWQEVTAVLDRAKRPGEPRPGLPQP